jgi:hypothetical protein
MLNYHNYNNTNGNPYQAIIKPGYIENFGSRSRHTMPPEIFKPPSPDPITPTKVPSA